MTFFFWLNIAALLLSFFVAGAMLGALFYELLRERTIVSLPPYFLQLLALLQKQTQ